MFRVLLLSVALFMSGCAVVKVPPINSGGVNSIKSGKTAVMFYDTAGKITYMEDSYQVLAITTSTTHASYKGFWDIDKDMSEFHAKNLRAYGINAESVYKKFSKKEAEYYAAKQPQMYSAYKALLSSDSKPETKLNIINEKLRKRLIKKGYDYLTWVPFAGYSLHMRTLGLGPIENFYMHYIFYDLKAKKIMWKGAFAGTGSVNLNGSTGKTFLEKNNLRGYKKQLMNLTKSTYTRGQNMSIGVSLGFLKPEVDPKGAYYNEKN